MATYMLAPLIGMPTPLHVLIEQERRAAHPAPVHVERPVELPIVTHTPKPWREIDISALTGSPAAFARKALAAGHEVKAIAAPPAVMVVVRSPRIRATWVEGKSLGAVVQGPTMMLARGVTVAEYLLTMPLDEADARAAHEAAERAAKAAATRAARAIQSGA